MCRKQGFHQRVYKKNTTDATNTPRNERRPAKVWKVKALENK